MFDKAFEMLQELKIKLKKTGKQKLRQFCTNKKKPLSKFDTFYSLNTQQT